MVPRTAAAYNTVLSPRRPETPHCFWRDRMIRNDLRNVAIIAHVDHGKTTLVDQMLKQSGLFRESELNQECILDSNPLERQRGITILAKNIAFKLGDVKINLIDTPGHADFGGEVERVLKMADGCFLLVDAAEGPLPQTRFVLRKAFAARLKPIVVINKIDRPDARAREVLNDVYDLFIDCEADDDALHFPVIYASGRQGVSTTDLTVEPKDLQPLYKEILTHIPPPDVDLNAPLQMLVVSLISDEFKGRIAVGRVVAGKIRKNQRVALLKRHGQRVDDTVVQLMEFNLLGRKEVDEIQAGDVCAVVGLDDADNGELHEPIEYLVVEVPANAVGPVMQLVLARRGECQKMASHGDLTNVEFTIPARGLIGLRTRLLNATGGQAVIHHNFHDYQPHKGEIPARVNGVMVATETGKATAFAIDNLQDRGVMFVGPMESVYEGQIVGEHCRDNDLPVNIVREKKLTNMRSATAEAKVVIKQPRVMSLEIALEYIEDDELVEITPNAIRLRKVLLKESDRKKSERQKA